MIDVFNLPTGLTASHIHVGSPGTAGPVVIDFAPQPSASRVRSGSRARRGPSPRAPAQGIRSMEDVMFAIAAGNAYVNVHSQANPGGEIRGQLCPDKRRDNRSTASRSARLPAAEGHDPRHSAGRDQLRTSNC